MNYDDAVGEVIQRGHMRFGKVWLSKHPEDLNESQATYIIESCQKTVADADQLITYLEAFFDQWNGRFPPKYGQFLQYAQQQERENITYQTQENHEDECFFCGGNGYMPIVLPEREDRAKPDWYCTSYTPGDPWDGPRMLMFNINMPCRCNRNSMDLGDKKQRIRDQHQAWYTNAAQGEWDLHPGETFGVTRSLHTYIWRSRRNDWLPADPIDDTEDDRKPQVRVREMMNRIKTTAESMMVGDN